MTSKKHPTKHVFLTGRKLGDWENKPASGKRRRKLPEIQRSPKSVLERLPHEHSSVGRRFEQALCEVFLIAKDAGKIADFVFHPPNSEEDKRGKDFTIVLATEEKRQFSFGVTTSSTRQVYSQTRHPNIPQFYFNPNENEALMLEKILTAATKITEERKELRCKLI